MVLKYTFSPSYFVIMDFFSSCNSWPNRFCLIRETLLLRFTYKKVEPAATKNSNKLSTTSSFQIWVLHFGIKLVYLSLNPRIFFVIYGRDNIPCLYFFYLDSRRRWEGEETWPTFPWSTLYEQKLWPHAWLENR